MRHPDGSAAWAPSVTAALRDEHADERRRPRRLARPRRHRLLGALELRLDQQQAIAVAGFVFLIPSLSGANSGARAYWSSSTGFEGVDELIERGFHAPRIIEKNES